MNNALVCIAKNEDNYIDEWIEYHLKLGFSKIIIYQNDWRYHGKYVGSNCIRLFESDGVNRQVPVYNEFMHNYHAEFDWAGFIDVDEFVVLKKHDNITEFLSDYREYDALGLNWNMFGSNGLEFNGEYSCIKRFTRCNRQLAITIKCFVNLYKVKNTALFKCPHGIYGVNKIIAVDKSHFTQEWCDRNNDNARNIAYLNHYYTKTRAEWNEKMARGWPCNMEKEMIPDYQNIYFNQNNTPEYNEYEDLIAYNFMFGDKAIR